MVVFFLRVYSVFRVSVLIYMGLYIVYYFYVSLFGSMFLIRNKY